MKSIYNYKNRQISNNKNILKKAIKQLPLYYIIIKTPNNSNSLIFGFLIISICSNGSKYTIKNKNSLTISAKSYYLTILQAKSQIIVIFSSLFF